MFPKIVVPQNGWFIMENSIKMDDLGGKPTIFGNIHIATWDWYIIPTYIDGGDVLMVNILGKYEYFITWSIWACKLQQKKWIPRKHFSFMIVLSYPITSNHPFDWYPTWQRSCGIFRDLGDRTAEAMQQRAANFSSLFVEVEPSSIAVSPSKMVWGWNLPLLSKFKITKMCCERQSSSMLKSCVSFGYRNPCRWQHDFL